MQISKYLVPNDQDKKWGLTVSTVGYEEIAPGEAYPTRGHADGYYFNTDVGRELNEYQLLYITEGRGVFRSTHFKEAPLREGDMFLLFPDERHSYHPLPNVGWKSHWIGFKGKNIDDRVLAGFLSVEKPIYHVGFSSEIVQLYKTAYETAVNEEPFSQQMMAGIVNHMVGIMYALERNMELNKNNSHKDMINRARLRIREALESNLTIQEIADELSMSYSNFRKLFKEYTGLSPAVYQQDLKLQRAKELLSTTDLSVKEIAYRLNFDSPDYFSAKFKIKTGRKPSEMRRK
ncbi:MAG: AraC family transcriptional regulator [Prevotella sp.]